MKFLTIEKTESGYAVMLYDTKHRRSGKIIGSFQKERWAYDGAWCAMRSLGLPLYASAEAGMTESSKYREKKTIKL